MKLILTLVLFSAGAGTTATSMAADSCTALLPKALVAAVQGAFPEYRMPVEADNLAQDIEYSRKHGDSGCLGVAIADFDGDGRKDFLLGLTSRKGSAPLTVIALTRGGSWRFNKLESWVKQRERLYVAAVAPGRYERTEALDGPASGDAKLTLACENSGALVGAIESTGIVYCHVDGRWPYVWVAD